MAADNIPTMIGISEAAAKTGLTYNCIRNLCMENKIVFVRTGAKRSKYLINLDKLIDYLNGDDREGVL